MIMQESLDFVRRVPDPMSAPSWQGLADLANKWSSRWPSMQHSSSAAVLTVIYTRDIVLQAVVAELAKTTQVPHKVRASQRAAQSRLMGSDASPVLCLPEARAASVSLTGLLEESDNL